MSRGHGGASAAALALVLAGCATSDDPGEGGFFSGVAGIAGGGYEARIDEREAAVAEAEARGAELDAELEALTRQHSDLKARIIQQRAALQAGGVRLSAASEAEVQRVLANNPQQPDPQTRAAALRAAIADARRLSAALAELSA